MNTNQIVALATLAFAATGCVIGGVIAVKTRNFAKKTDQMIKNSIAENNARPAKQ